MTYSTQKDNIATLILLLSIVLGHCSDCLASDPNWHQFRGPSGQGLVTANLPIDLASSSNQVWKYETDGIGWSSPVIADGQIWFTTAVIQKASPEEIAARLADVKFAQIKTVAAGVEFHAICLDASTGKRLHDITLAKVSEPDPINPMNSYASPTPAISGDRIVCHFGNYGTWCLNTKSGETLWRTELVVDHSVGPGSSPIIAGDKVLLVCDGIDQQFVAGIYLSNGKLAWKTDRPPIRATNPEYKKAYSTPLLIPVNGKSIAVIPGAQWTVAYEPENGDELWRVDCGDGFSTTPMPIYDNGLVVISTGYMRPEFVAIRPDGKGDVTKTHVAWRASRGAPTMPSAVVSNGKMFSISDAGILTMYDMKSGEEIHRNRIGGNFSASPILAGGKLYLSSREGLITIVQADESLNVISTNPFDSPLMASPAVIDNDIIIRSEKSITRITSK